MKSMGDHTGHVHTHGHVIHWARLYDVTTGWLGLGKRWRRRTVERAGVRPGERVLDVGCGPGVLTLLAKERVGQAGEAHGIDPSPEMIALAQTKAAKTGLAARFQIGAVQELPFPDGRFDVVLSSLMLHHVPDDLKGKAFAEIARVLRPGGRLVAVDFSGTGIRGRLLRLVGHRLRRSYVDDLVALMREAGLRPDALPARRQALVTIVARKPEASA
jgi:ubiquinone/menaquinone biosynthesis C-methylase UbiE